ncbi:MAG: polyphenol oxidase family protein [Deltaproteobacteria bacterium]|nr:polyphenol oxidase family protein [Deltaproteobacteria bacterium]
MIEIITSKLLSDVGVVHGFAVGADFSKKEGFEALQKQLGTQTPMFKIKQVHGNAFGVTSEMTPVAWTETTTVEADALIGDAPGCIGVVTADCVPILLYCKNSGLTAAIHAGWKGLKAGVVNSTVKAMFQKGAMPGSILCAIGPCICFDCYDVGEDVANLFPESSEPIPGAEGQYFLDLAQAAEVSLIATGLSTARMERMDICTSCSDRGLYSYRKSHGDCGRQYSFICKE